MHLHHFFAIRGPAKQLRSDCGTNFGACKELGFTTDHVIQKYLNDHGCLWQFIFPHASYMGGAQERTIGITCKFLDIMLLQNKSIQLTHKVLCTLMAEVSAIINVRPLVLVSSDPETPLLLTPLTVTMEVIGEKYRLLKISSGYTENKSTFPICRKGANGWNHAIIFRLVIFS